MENTGEDLKSKEEDLNSFLSKVDKIGMNFFFVTFCEYELQFNVFLHRGTGERSSDL